MDFSDKKCIVMFRRNAVAESIRSGKALHVYVDAKHEKDSLVSEAKSRGIDVSVVSSEKLNKLASHQPHQGLVCLCNTINTISLGELIQHADLDAHPLILILDGIEDPHNLGAILRSSDAFAIGGIIVKKIGNAPLNTTVANVSTGAIHYVPVAEVTNLNQAISTLKDAGYWIVSSEGSAKMSYTKVDYDRKLAIVVGSEGFGISKLVIKNSDYVVKIPMNGHVNSLNASVAAGIMLGYARSRQWDE